LLRRNWKVEQAPADLIEGFQHDIRCAQRAQNLGELLGSEGLAAARYFGAFSSMVSRKDDESLIFDFEKRNRRPPTDPVNALLSYSYALLVRAWTMALTAVGFDPYRGFYHQPRYGRPALALDMMEPFRPLVAESVVVGALNTGEVSDDEFVITMGGVVMKPAARRSLTQAYERRMATEVTHPVFGYRCSYRRVFEIQARLFARYLLGELVEYPAFCTR
jgi:CRISPR-associated endonuclease Cas1